MGYLTQIGQYLRGNCSLNDGWFPACIMQCFQVLATQITSIVVRDEVPLEVKHMVQRV